MYQTPPCNFPPLLLQHIQFLLVRFASSHFVNSTLYRFALRARVCIYFLLLLTATGTPLSNFWQVQVTCAKSQFQRFREVHWAVQNTFAFVSLRFIPRISLLIGVSPILPYILALVRGTIVNRTYRTRKKPYIFT